MKKILLLSACLVMSLFHGHAQSLTRGTGGTQIFDGIQGKDPFANAMLAVRVNCLPANTPSASLTTAPSSAVTPTATPNANGVSPVTSLVNLSLVGLLSYPTKTDLTSTDHCRRLELVERGRPIRQHYCIYTGEVGGLFIDSPTINLATLPVPTPITAAVDRSRPLTLIVVGMPEVTTRSGGKLLNQKLQMSTGTVESFEIAKTFHIIKRLSIRGMNPTMTDYEISGSILSEENLLLPKQSVSMLTFSRYDGVQKKWINTTASFQCRVMRTHVDDNLNVIS